MSDHGYRDARQSDAFAWGGRTFGEINLSKRERARRFIEEALELAQACGLTKDDIRGLYMHVYNKPPGQPSQEAGGVGVTLLMLCQVLGISADHAERTELARVQNIPAQYFRDRHNVKALAGVADAVSEPGAPKAPEKPKGYWAGL